MTEVPAEIVVEKPKEEKVECECGKQVLKRNMAAHLKSTCHILKVEGVAPDNDKNRLKRVEEKVDLIIEALKTLIEMAEDMEEGDDVIEEGQEPAENNS